MRQNISTEFQRRTIPFASITIMAQRRGLDEGLEHCAGPLRALGDRDDRRGCGCVALAIPPLDPIRSEYSVEYPFGEALRTPSAGGSRQDCAAASLILGRPHLTRCFPVQPFRNALGIHRLKDEFPGDRDLLGRVALGLVAGL